MPESSQVAPSTSTDQTSTDRDGPGRWRTVVGTGIGNALEWYDWNVYAVFAPFFAAQFFPESNAASALLASLAIFAVGFLMRPLGGLLFGWLGDRVGRRSSMITSIALAAGGSLLIGIAPTYTTLGVWASVLLLFARLVQGLAHGGELPAAQTYVSEMAPRGTRGRWSSLIYVSGTSGILLGTLLGALLSTMLTEQQLQAWGWRIPFLLGGVIGLYALVMRMRMVETEAFEQEARKRSSRERPSLWRGFRDNRTACLRVIGLTLGGTVVYYMWAVSATARAISVKGIDPSAALWVGVLANIVLIAVLPLFGILSDRVGRKPVLYLSFVGGIVLTFPLNWLIQDRAWQLAVSMIVAMVFIAAGVAIMPAVFAEMFPTGIRATGLGFPYALAVALCGGTAPYLQTALEKSGAGNLFLGYAVVLLVLALVVVYRMPETRNVDLG